jgi:uncharacterized protein with ParB-like and HNH nuclease domain
MKAEECKLSKILTDSRVYEIPRYQRPYSWTEKHTQDLINDVYDAFENKQPEYFIGSIITIEKSKDDRFEVVDGQQRLTTLNLVLSKLRDLIEDSAAKQEVQKRILPVDVLTGEAEKPRLLVREKDRKFFTSYVLAGNHNIEDDNLSETQRRFVNNLSEVETYLKGKDQLTLKLFAKYFLDKVYVVFVTTDSFASAYRLFNVLNARGLSLSNSDLLKNKLFDLGHDSEAEQTNIEDSWNELEDLIGLEDLDIFLSHHRTSILGNKQQAVLFEEYEKYLTTYKIKPSAFCEELLKSATNYIKISKNDFPDEKTKRLILSLKNVSYDEWIPPFLSFMNKGVKGLELSDFLSLLERITMQNWVRRFGRTKRNTVYYNIIGDINQNKSGADLITTIKGFANNDEFASSLKNDVYGMGYAAAILMRIDCEMHDESVAKTYNGVISVEHILPQSPKEKYWLDRFSTDQHKSWVHKLGNLALLSGRKNSAAQNYSFDKKKDIYKNRGGKVSFELTKEVCNEDDWTVNTIEARQDKLIRKALEIWSI